MIGEENNLSNKIIWESKFSGKPKWASLDYDYNWNHLMPVVRKIREDALARKDTTYWLIVAAALYQVDIEKVFNAVIIYINKSN